MITAKFERVGDGVLSMNVRGHAGFAELGKDPVCAGASVLAMTAAQCVKFMEEEGKLQKKANITIRDGRVTVVAKPKPEHFDEALQLYTVAETGMRLLAEAYHDHITLTPFATSSEKDLT